MKIKIKKEELSEGLANASAGCGFDKLQRENLPETITLEILTTEFRCEKNACYHKTIQECLGVDEQVEKKEPLGDKSITHTICEECKKKWEGGS